MPSPSLTPDVRHHLTEALLLARGLLSSDADPQVQVRRRDRLRHIQSHLKQYAHPICHDHLPVEVIPLAVRRAFVRASLLVSRYHELAGCFWQGTLPSLTLTQYRPDPSPQQLQDITALVATFGLSLSQQHSLQTELTTIDARIAQQAQMITAVLDSVTQQQPLSSANTQHLFQYLFGKIPIPAAALNCFYTKTQLYFCLDYQGTQLRSEALWASLSPLERSQIEQFLTFIQRLRFDQFAQFPVFGPCFPEHIDDGWCQDLAQMTGMSTSQIRQSLRRSVNIIATSKAEAFLMHDIWGHSWQWILTQFQSDYAILTTCDEPLRGAETAYTPQGPLTCWDLFETQSDQVSLHVERAKAFFHGEVQQRLGLMFTHVLAELIADVAEFKFVSDHPDLSTQLPSSSIFKDLPTKLDLSLADVDYLFLRILQPLLDVHSSVLSESQLETDLIQHWRSQITQTETFRVSLKQAIVQMHQVFLETYQQAYLSSMQADSSLFAHIVCNLLYLQNVVNYLCSEYKCPNSQLPFRDLLLVFIGSYCAQDSYAEFWDIDDILAGYFLPCWYHLQARCT